MKQQNFSNLELKKCDKKSSDVHICYSKQKGVNYTRNSRKEYRGGLEQCGKQNIDVTTA